MAKSSAVAASDGLGAKLKRRPRGSLDVEDIITGAFELAEDVSVSGLSMPVVARHLGVPLTSIYWHFRKKEDLLDAMTDRAIKQYHFTTPFEGSGAWQDALRNHFRKMRRVFQENPVLCELVLMRSGELSPEATHASVDNLEKVVKTMVDDAGFKPDDALTVYLALSAHTRGTAMIERLNASQQQGGRRRLTGVTTAHPLLNKLETKGHTIDDVEFEFTLDAIIKRADDGLALAAKRNERGAK
ncbi:TetR family transcriptional regulator [Mycobacterium sp. Aquia_213]|uniref:TetR family transcriptional regulator n=1 Tax=Mycobacterium sp. Aquia_213 TaxID=2991728 RepID=UPI0022722649|nr:TetR family transcriptional regulator [Mycobacterium sp. Aquia_213]WAC90140.1 TetR family transcriptional regulator [Mycobacterium sp. Aquia_213]